MRNVCILLALLLWFIAVVIFALARCWVAVVPLLALAGIIENITHHAQIEE